MTRSIALLLFAAAVAAVPARAQDTINAERPGFSSSPLTLAEDRWQLEGGYQFQQVTGSVDVHTAGLFLLRYGAGPKAELQFAWGGYSRVDAGPGNVSGVTDASAGIKWQLTEDNAVTKLGVFAGLSLPVGNNDFSSNEVDPTLGLFWTHDGPLSLFGTVLLSEFDSETALSNAVGVSLPVSDRCRGCGAYVEYFGTFPEDGGPQHNLNGGLTFLQGNDLQFDVHVGLGLNDRAPDSFVGLGFAWRY